MKSRTLIKSIILVIVLVAIVGVGLVVYRLNKINAFIWLGDYTFDCPTFGGYDGLVDIIFVVPDHWEPGSKRDILYTWMTRYRELADKHVDADGVRLQHDWYYPLDQFDGVEVESLAVLCAEGYGDVGVQLHHRDDTSESLRRKFTDGLDSLQAHGALISPDGKMRFSFVHGNWALDNSRHDGGRNYCGVNDEISILLDLGCYADVTFPSLNQTSQPSMVDKIFYVRDDPEKPKSHDRGIRSSVGLTTTPDQLMLFQGPLMIDWADWRFKTHPTIEDGCMYWEIPTSFHRFKIWLKANIHVAGRPNWIFVRPFTHGADFERGGYENILGERIDSMLTQIEAGYNDGVNYRLHYMTVREAYNVVKAAEAGHDGNPNEYRDFVIPPYRYEIPQEAKEAL